MTTGTLDIIEPIIEDHWGGYQSASSAEYVARVIDNDSRDVRQLEGLIVNALAVDFDDGQRSCALRIIQALCDARARGEWR